MYKFCLILIWLFFSFLFFSFSLFLKVHFIVALTRPRYWVSEYKTRTTTMKSITRAGRYIICIAVHIHIYGHVIGFRLVIGFTGLLTRDYTLRITLPSKGRVYTAVP
jgi:hypothetical protein